MPDVQCLRALLAGTACALDGPAPVPGPTYVALFFGGG